MISESPTRTPLRIFRPPAPVEVKNAGRFAFVQTPLLGYNQGWSPPRAALMESPVQENRTPGYFDRYILSDVEGLSAGLCGGQGRSM